MGSFMQPRANLGGVSRQPFRPGQWQGFRGVSKNTTYIQNNFYGSSIFGANRNFGYIQNGCNGNHHCDGGGDVPKWMKWMVGIGTGASILGSILKLFSKDKSESGGETSTDTTNTNTPNTPATNTSAANTPNNTSTASEPAVTSTTQPAVDSENGNGNNNNGDYSNLNNLNSMVCRDNSGKTQNISGQFTIKEAGENGGAPKSITITDSSSGTPHEYTYELTGTTSDGKPIYTCKSMNGQAASENAYTLEMNGKDGKPELVQYEGQANHGSGLRFGALSEGGGDASTITQGPTPPPTTTTPPTSTEVPPNTSAPDDAQSAQETQNRYTANDKSNARAQGQSVADDLVGYTNNSEKNEVLRVMNTLNSDNIADFLDGYRNNKGLGDELMTQINSEYGWSNEEKLQAQKQVVSNMLQKAQDAGIEIPTSNIEYLNKFLDTNPKTTKISSQAAANLDKIINGILEKIKAKEAEES